jgi:hypothetical protein
VRTPGAVALAALVALTAPARADPTPPETRPHRELNIFPLVGGSSDVGIGVGEVSNWALIEPGHDEPYGWKAENGAFITFKPQAGGLVIPFQDYYILYTLLDIGPQRRIRLDVRPAVTNESTLKYYGLGNASPPPPADVAVGDTEYRRVHPTLLVEARVRLAGPFYLLLGNVYTHNWLQVPGTSLLARDQSMGTPEVQKLLGSFAPHGVDLIELGLQYDTRDSAIVTRQGMFHAVKARFSPAVPGWLPYQYVQLDATAQLFFTPLPRWLSVSWRGVADALLGAPPFYELARFDETPAIGGGKAVRGVPAQRYYGKVKLFQNLEARSELFPFTLRNKPFVLGVAAFVDAGRTWTELFRAHPDLDGTGLGLKYGIGGGLRLQEGRTFIVRADVAWSPDATPIGAYFAAGQIF